MKKLTVLLSAILIFNCFSLTISAEDESNNEHVIPDGYDSYEQYKMIPDYYDDERVASRNAKIENIDNVAENPNLRSGNRVSIGLPYRKQHTRYNCAAATAEMIIDYQLGVPNTWYQDDMANEMQLNQNHGLYSTIPMVNILRRATGLNFEAQRISELPLMNALRADINSYVGLAVFADFSVLHPSLTGGGGHSVAAKGYTNDSVFYNDPWDFDGGIYGEHEININSMTYGINQIWGIYIW